MTDPRYWAWWQDKLAGKDPPAYLGTPMRASTVLFASPAMAGPSGQSPSPIGPEKRATSIVVKATGM